MIEIQLMLNDLQKMYSKEKSIRSRVLLEKVITHLKEYENTVSPMDVVVSSKKI